MNIDNHIIQVDFMQEQLQPKLLSQSKENAICEGGIISLKQMFCSQKSCQPSFLPSSQIKKYLEQLESEATNDMTIYIYNLSQLVYWTYLQLNRFYKEINIDETSLNIAVFMMKMMEILIICRFIRTIDIKNQNQNLQKELILLIKQRKLDADLLGKKIKFRSIKESQCLLISENKRKEAHKIINQYDVILQKIALRYQAGQISQTLKHAEGDIQFIFKSILRNLGRKILAKTQQTGDSSELITIFLKLFYLMVGLDNQLQEIINNIKNDLMHKYRKLTYIHLLSQANGLKMLSVYLQQAPLTDISKDIKLMRELLDNRKK